MHPRLVPRPPGELIAAQAPLYEKITGGQRASGPQVFPLTDEQGALNGPFGPMLLAPAVGEALQELGVALRYRTSLTPRTREMVILTVATHHDSAFERFAHEPVGRQAGLTDEEIDRLREPLALHPADAPEAATVAVTRLLLTTGDLPDDEYDPARRVLGDAAIVEVISLVGYYSLLAMLMRVYRIGVPGAGTEELR